MTVVMGAITDDAIVLSADGRALKMDTDEHFTNSARKLFHIKNGVYWGVAASAIHLNEMEQLANWFQLYLPVVPPYGIKEIAILFSKTLEHVYKDDKRDKLRMDIIIAGYGRDVFGRLTKPEIFCITSEDGYTNATVAPKIAIGNMQEGDFSLEGIPSNTDEAIRYMRTGIKKTSEHESSVGGDIITVIIRGSDVEETIQTSD